MGSFKPLLPLGSCTVLERVVGAVTEAGVQDIVVVTGHESARLTPVLDRLPVRSAHNADYDSGMFSSVLAGVAALPADVEAFFVLPADYPLVRSQVCSRLLAAFTDGDYGIVHPTTCGRRGHPPLLAGRYAKSLLQDPDARDLGSFLQRHTTDTGHVEVQDLSILIDIDTEDDYRRTCRLADPDPQRCLSRQDALYLLALLGTPERVLEHCQAVSAVGEALARALQPHVPTLDVELVSTAGLLHDMAHACERHAEVGAALLYNLGLDHLASVVECHMVLPESLQQTRELTEEHLVYLADKLVAGSELVGLEERAARKTRELGGSEASPEALQGMGDRMAVARAIRDKVEAALGAPIQEVLTRAVQ